MYAVAVDKNQLKKTLGIIAAIAVLAALAVVIGGKLFGGGQPDGAIPGDTAEQREQYLSSLGLEFSRSSTVVEVAVPDEFDERFTEYNEMLRTAGFDLEPHRGETVTKCTYIISNRGDIGTNVNAVLLVRDGCIIAAHLVSVDDGSLHPMVGASQTILPTQNPQPETQPPEDAAETSYPID